MTEHNTKSCVCADCCASRMAGRRPRKARKSRPIIVKKYRSNRALERGLTEMTSRGYEVQAQATNNNGFSYGQSHVVTFVK